MKEPLLPKKLMESPPSSPSTSSPPMVSSPSPPSRNTMESTILLQPTVPSPSSAESPSLVSSRNTMESTILLQPTVPSPSSAESPSLVSSRNTMESTILLQPTVPSPSSAESPSLVSSRNTMESTALPPSPPSSPSRNRGEPPALSQTSTPSRQLNPTDSENNDSQANDPDNGSSRNNTLDRNDSGNNNTGQSATLKKRILLIAFCIVYFIGTVAFFYGTANGLADSLYFTVATITTTGYGDIVPKSASTKIYTVIFALIGLPLFSALPTSLQDWPRAAGLHFLTCLGIVHGNWLHTLFQTYTQSMRNNTRMSRGMNVLVVIGCVVLGAVVVHCLESLNWADSFYLSVISATTIGYGDYSFTTKAGRIVAVFWLWITTLVYSRALSCLTMEINSWLTSPQ